MEVLAILFWFVVLGADIAFMCNIKRIADEWFPWDGSEGKRPWGKRACKQIRSSVDAVRIFEDGQGV